MVVERYMLGEMNAAEEQEFFMSVATDGELLQTLRAHRRVERALVNDRDTLPSGYVAVQERALAMLASQPSPATSSGTGRWFSGSRLAGWAAVASTAVIFTVTGYVGRGYLDQPDITSLQSSSAVRTQVTTPSKDAPVQEQTVPVAPLLHETPAASATEARSQEGRTATPTTVTPSESFPAAGKNLRAERKASTPREQHPDTPVERIPNQAETRSTTVAEQTPDGQERLTPLPPKSDSVGFRMKLTLPRR
jgi:hypothetical protein